MQEKYTALAVTSMGDGLNNLDHAHVVKEWRNKSTPATNVMEELYELLGSSRPFEDLWHQLVGMREELARSIGLLREADFLAASHVMLQLVADGNYQPEMRSVRLSDELSKYVKDIGSFAAANVCFEVDLNNMDAVALVDTRALAFVATHLLINSRRHTSTGRVSLGLTKADSGMLDFRVVDTGTGISSAQADLAFKAPTTLGHSGLAVSRALLDSIGGHLWLESSQLADTTGMGGRTEIRFSLPGKTDSAPGMHGHRRLPDGLEMHVVEDSRAIRAALVRKLNLLGQRAGVRLNVYEHPNAESFVPLVESLSCRPDVVVLVDENLDMGGGILRGVHVIKALVQASFQGVIVSASGDDSADHSAAHLRWSKPYPPVANMLDSLQCVYTSR